MNARILGPILISLLTILSLATAWAQVISPGQGSALNSSLHQIDEDNSPDSLTEATDYIKFNSQQGAEYYFQVYHQEDQSIDSFRLRLEEFKPQQKFQLEALERSLHSHQWEKLEVNPTPGTSKLLK